MDIVLVELILFAAVGFLIGGIDDALLDLVWIFRSLWRRVVVYRRHTRATVDSLASTRIGGRLAVFVPAWDEGAVIGQMLRNTLNSWTSDRFCIFVGCYPNDKATQSAVFAIDDPRIRPVILTVNGPTTKSDCLNHLWREMRATEQRQGIRFQTVILHDAEDVVHPDELALFDSLTERFALVQIPVLPLAGHSWISDHYLDEFAEAHGKSLIVREALGAALPSAGVGCAMRTDVLQWLAEQQQGNPFALGSLTEDYEAGLRIGGAGFRGVFVKIVDRSGGGLVAVRALFPETLAAAVNQKTRWTLGIALAGWDRLGWHGGAVEKWMRLRDRRAVLAAIVMTAAYASALLALGNIILGHSLPILPFFLQALLAVNGLLLLWRLFMRFFFVTRYYGVWEGFRSIPRALISNLIAIMASYRALWQYVRHYRAGRLTWSKTAHKFPDL